MRLPGGSGWVLRGGGAGPHLIEHGLGRPGAAAAALGIATKSHGALGARKTVVDQEFAVGAVFSPARAPVSIMLSIKDRERPLGLQGAEHAHDRPGHAVLGA